MSSIYASFFASACQTLITRLFSVSKGMYGGNNLGEGIFEFIRTKNILVSQSFMTIILLAGLVYIS